MDRKTKTALLTLFLILGTFQASAQQNNASEVRGQLQEAEEAIQQMNNTGIPIERVESLLTTANNSFQAQKALAEEGGTPDYTRTLELTEKILELKETAIQVNDRLKALQQRIDQLENDTNLNLTEVKNAFQRVNTTFHNQRFSEAEDQVGQVYTQISEARSAQTRLQAFAASQRQNFASMYSNAVSYASENWLVLLISGGLFGGLGYVARQELKLVRLEKKKSDLKEEKEIIEQMIEQAQREYFVKRKGSKITFETRMDKFQDMLRDTEESLNTVENRIEQLEGLPVVTPKIKEKAEEFTESGEIKTEIEEVEKPLGQQPSGTEEEVSEETGTQEESGEKEKEEAQDRVNPYEVLVNESTVKEAKARIEKIEEPDYEAIMEAEKANKDRVTLERYLERKIEEQKDQEEVSEDEETEEQEKAVEVKDSEEETDEERRQESGEKGQVDAEEEENEESKETEEESEDEAEEAVEPEVKVVEPDEEVRDVSQTVEEVESPESIEMEGEDTIEQELGPEFTSHPAARPENEESSEAETGTGEEMPEPETEVEETEEKPLEVKESGASEEQESEDEEGSEPEEEEKSAAEKLQEAFSKASKDKEETEEDSETEEPEAESKEKAGQKESSKESEEKGLEVVEKDGKYVIPELDKEFDTESAANLYLEHFG